MEKYTMFMDWKNQYSENEYTTQSNLQIQCNPYQATNSILHGARTNNFTICMEIQKTSNSQSDLEKEEWNWRNQPYLTSGSTTKPQSSRQYGTGTKTEIQINRTKQKAQRQIHSPMDTLSSTKEARIYNGEKTTSLTSGAGKTGQPLVKEICILK